MKKFFASVLLSTLAALGNFTSSAMAYHQTTPSLGTTAPGVTSVQVYNAYSVPVTVGIVIQNTWTGCTTSVTNVVLYDPAAPKGVQPTITTFGTSGLTGYFTIPNGHTYTVTGGTASCLQGCILSFGSFQVCPCNGKNAPVCPSFTAGKASKIPLVNGVNAAEFSVNPPSGQQESGDITCVNGVNSSLQMAFTPSTTDASTTAPKKSFWNDGVNTYKNAKTVSNSWIDVQNNLDTNCSRVGVFPYNLTNCINNLSSPPCGKPICTRTLATCQFQRAAVNGQFGGTIKITYVGPLFPPS